MAERNISEWVKGLHEKGAPKLEALAKELTEDRGLGLKKIREMNLPCPQQFEVVAHDFLKDPSAHTQHFRSEKVYLSVTPRNPAEPRFRTPGGVTRDAMASFVRDSLSRVPVEKQNEYRVIGLEYFENNYGGTIIVSSDGRFLIECVRGHQGPVAAGSKTPEFLVSSDPFNGVARYSFEDERMRSALYSLLKQTNMVPGYYEFALVQEGSDDLAPKFFDYKDNAAYQLPSADIFNP